jgi:hypothetical protein
MKTTKLIQRATELKKQGFTHIASIVKSYYRTNYYHVVSIDDILKAGKWISAEHVYFQRGAHGRLGISENKVDWSKTVLKAYLKYRFQ